ncbi:MAG: ATP-NAD kinase family protein [Candidatus Hodarchaeales archaeon]
MRTVGFLINPIAGMGGRVGLKGTDSSEILLKAIQRGAKPVAEVRAKMFLKAITAYPECDKIKFIVPQGKMGRDIFSQLKKEGKSLNFTILDNIAISEPSTNIDTFNTSKALVKLGVDLLIFVGGDGTARDVLKAIGHDTIPILGIPSGVKIHSGVFALTVNKAAQILVNFVNDRTEIVESEIIDLDENEFREDRIKTRMFGTALVPSVPTLLQVTKSSTNYSNSEIDNITALTNSLKPMIRTNEIYILGSGSTIKKISKAFGHRVFSAKTVLGIDIVKNDNILKKDAYEQEILEILDKYPKDKVTVILTPIGGQGFILGRGNQQISPKVVRTVGFNNFLIVATKNKIHNLADKTLHIDTGDPSLDKELSGYKKVLVDFNEFWMIKIN